MSVSYLPYCLDKIPNRNSLRRERFTFTTFKGASLYGREAMSLEGGHIVSKVRKQRTVSDHVEVPLSFLFSQEHQHMEGCCPLLR